MRILRQTYCVLFAVVAACSAGADMATSVSVGGAGSDAGASGFDASSEGDAGSSSGRDDDCADAARLVYVVDSDEQLYSFRPNTQVFTSIGTLNCPSTGLGLPGFGGTPFSMSVDRNGIAWVLYDTGELFRVDTKDASCTATNRTAGQGGFSSFGMGFASNAANSDQETLYIASNGGGGFGSLDTATGLATGLGTVSGSPELTGTGAGDLWGFFPDSSPPRIDLMNKVTGATVRSITLASLRGMPQAWAFAFWGGSFWLFLQRTGDSSTVVYRVEAATGALTTSVPNSGKRIVGAGVSTCAPLII